MTSASAPMKRKVLVGTSWVFLGYGFSMALRFGSSLIMTRLLFPEIYGVMSIVWSFLYAVAMLSDIGTGSAVIQSAKGDNSDFLNTAWCLQIARGVLIALVCFIAGWPMAILYDKPELATIIPVLGITAIFQGFRSTKLLTLQRKIELHKLTALDLVVQITVMGVTILCAYRWQSVWALVPGPIIGELLRTSASHFLISDYTNRLKFHREYLQEIFKFGRWVFLSSAFYFLSRQSDRFLLGYLGGLSLLGVYSVAAQIIDAVENLVTKLNHNVLYPTLSQINSTGDNVKLGKVFYKIRLAYELVGFPALAVLAALSPEFISKFYDVRYVDAGWIMQLLICKVALYAMFTSSETCLVAIGKPHYTSIRNGCKMIWILVGMPITWLYAGLEGVLLLLISAELLSIVIFWPALAKVGVLKVYREFVPIVLFVIVFGLIHYIKIILTQAGII